MALFPDISATDTLSVELLRQMIPNYVIKPSNETRTSTTVVASDLDLVVPLEANAVTYVKFVIRAAAIAAADIKTAWSVPSGATGSKHTIAPSTVAASSNADNITTRLGVYDFTAAVGYNGVRDSNTLAFLIIEEGIVTTTNAGNCVLQWAQNTSNATATVVTGGSWVEYRRIG